MNAQLREKLADIIVEELGSRKADASKKVPFGFTLSPPDEDRHMFEVAASADRDRLLQHADNLMCAAKKMMTDLVVEQDEDKAYVTAFLIDTAHACYEAIGAKP